MESEKLKDRQAIEPALLSIQRTCAYLGLSPATVYRLMGAGKLAPVKFGAKTLIRMDSVKAFVASLPAARIKTCRRGHR